MRTERKSSPATPPGAHVWHPTAAAGAVLVSLLVTAGSAAFAAATPRGILVEDLNRRADPCTDFYDYANGTWRAENGIPSYMDRWSRRWASGETNKENVHEILAELAKKSDWPRGSADQLAGDHFAACMDEDAVHRLGVKPAEPWLAAIDAIRDRAALEAEIRRFHDMGAAVPFRLSAQQDLHEPERMVADISAGGLGLPDRDYYLRDEPRFAEARTRYREHMAKMLTLAGADAAAAARDAETIFAFERKLAEASLDNVALRDPASIDHPTTFAELTKLAPRFDWARYFDEAKLPRVAMNVSEPKFLEAFDRLLAEAPLADWRAYLRWHLLDNTAEQLARPIVDENFAFYGAYLAGTTEQKPRWKKCVENTDGLLGDALGQKYVEKYFPPAAKARMQEMVGNILAAMGDTIRGLDWMGPETRTKALEKLSTFTPKIGYPDHWKSYDGVTITRSSYWDNVMAASRWLVADGRSQIGKPVDRSRWGMTAPTSNAYYNPLMNEIVFPAGILQPPGFDMTATDAVNYGGIGVVIGHEVSHGFDDQGAQFDAQGRLRNWWTADDLARFTARGQCVVDQFEGYFIEPGIHHNGKLVLGEAIGDLAGAKLAWLGYRKSREGKPEEPTIDGFTPAQQFFLAWAQWRGDEIRPETQRLMVQGDPHPIAKYRVIGPLSNLEPFREAFGCRADAPMIRPPAVRCEVW
ncbi:MAG: M13 family metallopeptidase [Thermoanaerobaculia bacterium]